MHTASRQNPAPPRSAAKRAISIVFILRHLLREKHADDVSEHGGRNDKGGHFIAPFFRFGFSDRDPGPVQADPAVVNAGTDNQPCVTKVAIDYRDYQIHLAKSFSRKGNPNTDKVTWVITGFKNNKEDA